VKTLAKRFPAARVYRASQIETRDACMRLARSFRDIGDTANAGAMVKTARNAQRYALKIARAVMR
jgi:hypothetical protein